MLFLLLFACPKSSVPETVPALPVTYVQASIGVGEGVSETLSERDAILAVLQQTNAPALDCYLSVLASHPKVYGELRVRIHVGADGGVQVAETIIGTINNAPLEACVLELVRALSFPEPTQAEGVWVSYPFLFTSDATPPQVVRALRIRHGLLDPKLETISEDPDAAPVQGQDGWWMNW